MGDIPGSVLSNVDAEKVALERQKLDLELNRLKHFWRDPDFWMKLSTLVVGVATVWGTIWFSFLGSDVHRLQTDKEKLAEQIKVLGADEIRLTNTNKDLENDKNALTRDKAALTAEVGNLQTKIGTDTSDLLLHLLMRQFAPPGTETDVTQEQAYLLLPGPASSLIKTLRDDAANRSQSVREIYRVLSTTPSRPLKAELMVILFEGTHDSRWKSRITQEFLDLVRPGIDWGVFSESAPQDERYAALLLLGEIHNWGETEKLNVCRSLIAGLEMDRGQPAAKKLRVLRTVFEQILVPPFSLQMLNKDSLDVTLRGFVIARDLSINGKETDDDRLAAMRFVSTLSREAAAAVVATVLADSDTSDSLRFDLDELMVVFPRGANRPKDDDKDHWEKWVSEHKDLVEPYMEDDLTELKEKISLARQTRKVKSM